MIYATYNYPLVYTNGNVQDVKTLFNVAQVFFYFSVPLASGGTETVWCWLVILK